jgi:hypothetical protein
MTEPLTLSNNSKELFREKLYLPFAAVLLFVIFTSLLLFLGIKAELPLFSIGVAGAIPLIFLMIRYPRFWIYVVTLTNIYFFYSRGADISPVEVIIAFQYLGSLLIWFFWEILVKRNKVVENIADLAVLFFLFIVVINSIIAYLNGVEILDWGREAANLMLVALYFPIRKYFTEKKHIITLLILYAIVVIVSALLHFYTYYLATTQQNLVYAYQMAMGIRVNQTLFTSAAIFGFIFALYNRNKTISVLLILFTTISILGLITSFSRTFWIILIFQIFAIIFYLSRLQRIKLIIYTTLTTILLLSSAVLFFPDKANIVVSLVEKRFLSSSKGLQDVSVQSRVDEYGVAWKKIKEYPLGGNGISAKFKFWNTLLGYSTDTIYIHNGYLIIMYRLGIPALIICFFPYFYYFIKGERMCRKLNDEFYRMLSLASVMSLLLLLISNVTAAQITQRESAFVAGLSFALIGIIIQKFKKEKVVEIG